MAPLINQAQNISGSSVAMSQFEDLLQTIIVYIYFATFCSEPLCFLLETRFSSHSPGCHFQYQPIISLLFAYLFIELTYISF